MLENLYMLFRIYPFGGAKIRAVKKEAKHYHFDWTVVKDPGGRFENLVACHLHKWCCFLQDAEGRDVELRYFRDIDKREVDFVVVENRKPIAFIECKINGKEPHSGLRYLKERFPETPALQLVRDEKLDVLTGEQIRICSAEIYLKDLV
jgi:predicted AAA+ superfamily ATPase